MWKTAGVAALILPVVLTAQTGQQTTPNDDNPEAKPPVTKADIQIVQRAPAPAIATTALAGEPR